MTHTSQPGGGRPDINRFFAVDQEPDAGQLIDFLGVAKALPGNVAAKTEILRRLEPGTASLALDVGCGYGADVLELARRLRPGGQAIGIDISETMIAEANRRAAGAGLDATFRVADAHALPFEDDTFDICRIETVLQHLAEPERAVAEMARVTRPGGRIAAFEFDAATVYVDHPDDATSKTIQRTWVDAAVQGTMGRQLPRLFAQAGVGDVSTSPRVIVSDAGFIRMLLTAHVDHLRDEGTLGAEDVDRWWSAVDAAAAAGHFTAGGVAFVVSGRVG